MKIKNKVSAKLLGSAMLSSVILLGSCQKEQELLPDTQPAVSEVNLKDSLNELAALTSVPSGFYDLTKALPSGYVKDGSKDYTVYVQKAINSYSKVAFPGFPILINDSGLKIPSNRYLTFLEGSELRLKPSSKEKYDMIRIENAYNVTLAHPNIVGDRYEHRGTSGEWGNGIGVYGSTKVNISLAKVINCWGDGIYVGKSSKGISKDIRLFKPYLKSNRRDGVSITSVDGLEMYRPYAGYSDGTSPYCGINIEPNSSIDEIKNIEITNPVTENNKGNGIQIGLTRMYSSADKSISIKITDHKDTGSFYAYKVSNSKPGNKGSLRGTISTANPVWKHNESRPLWMSQTEKELDVRIIKPQITGLPGSTVSKLESAERQLKFGLKSVSVPYILSL